ncbi:hypothetical protein LMG33818_002188 [Halomonadaceae bacterium LMG 33818]|uniref:hypothetical protein n=1 Tax=Cernens ardua TaxID=3402176 RepID=UPI003EDC79D8
MRYIKGCLAATLLVTISMILNGCASAPQCTALECHDPHNTANSMVIWWAPSMSTQQQAKQSTDWDRVYVPH